MAQLAPTFVFRVPVTTPRPPAGLGRRGRAYWRQVMADYDLSLSEVEVLREICRTLDTLDQLAEVLAKDGAMVRGSMGQPVVHPALNETRGHRQVLHKLLAALQLPDAEGDTLPNAAELRSRSAAETIRQQRLRSG